MVPHPETVTVSPAGGSNSEVGGGKRTAWAEGTLRSNGASNYHNIYGVNKFLNRVIVAYEEKGNVILEGVRVVARVDGDADNVADLLEAAVDVQFVFAGNNAQSG